jgi:hypothetical protein
MDYQLYTIFQRTKLVCSLKLNCMQFQCRCKTCFQLKILTAAKSVHFDANLTPSIHCHLCYTGPRASLVAEEKIYIAKCKFIW